MHRFLSAVFSRKGHRALWVGTWLLACPAYGFSQYSSSFDSAFRAAENLPAARSRLLQLKPLVNQSYESSPFQTVSFGKALLRAATEVHSDTDRYQAHVVLCTGYERSRNYEPAINNALLAANMARQRKDYVRQVRALQLIAFTYSSLGLMTGDPADQQKALRQCGEAMNLVQQQGIREEASYTLATAADVHAMFKQYDTAIALYYRAIAAHKAQGQAVPMGLYMNLGNTLDLEKDYSGSFAAYRMADSINEKGGNSAFYKWKIASNRAILYNDMGRAKESEQQALAVLAAARQMGAADIQVDMVDHLKKLCQKQGRFSEALAFSDSLAAIKERMLNAEKTGQVAEMQARYDAGVKDQQIIVQQETIRQNRRQRLGLWGGMALLFGVGSAAFAGLRRSRRLNRKITTQQQQLVAQKAELQRMNETKDRLFSLIGHDMRMPLNSLMAYATLLDQQGDLPPEKIKKYNTDLRQSLGYTTVLMENLLHFAQTQMQAMQPRPETIALEPVLNRTLMLLGPALEQKNIGLRTHYDGDTTAFADEDMTDVILRNLLSNAIKFSNPGGCITISVKPCADAAVCCTIQDQGTGMHPELTALWNAPAVPLPVRSRLGTQEEKGAGLGLMLSKTFAALMGGHLFAESAEGKGSSFSLQLPQKKPLT